MHLNQASILTNTSNTTDSTYTIRLTVGDVGLGGTGCFHTFTSDTITVYPLPLPVISMKILVITKML